jgi:hypothetical protein
MTFDHDFGDSYPLFSSLLKKEREEVKENELAKMVIKCHVFLLDQKCNDLRKIQLRVI